MLIEKDFNYQEGLWAGKRMIPRIDQTSYETIEFAIEVKQSLVDNFEKEFGYSREMDEFDSNYSYNVGILDALKSEYNGNNSED